MKSYLRLRPGSGTSHITINDNEAAVGSTSFQFTGILSDDDESVFEVTTKPLLARRGDSLVFAYGVSGGGKTHTISSLIPLAIQHALTLAPVSVTFLEIYNEKIFDLLDKRKQLKRKAAKEVQVSTINEARAVIQAGQDNRQVSTTLLNATSSRSHSIFTIKIGDATRLSIVDLAGSERIRHTMTEGERLKEAGSINKSLMVLGQCMEIMRKNQEKRKQSIVPFRHSKLTEIFQHYFTGGDGEAVLIAAVNPYHVSAEENVNVLRFASLAQQIIPVSTSTQQIPLLAEDTDESDNEDEFVEMLLDEIRSLRRTVVELEIASETKLTQALQESEDRAEEEAQAIEERARIRLKEEIERQEYKADRKLDILARHHEAQMRQLKTQYEAQLAQLTEQSSSSP